MIPRLQSTTTITKKPAHVTPDAPGFTPIRVLEVEIGEPLPDVAALDPHTGRRYHRAQVLVRVHTQPLGLVEVCLGEHGLDATQVAVHVWQALSREINQHLRQDNLPAVAQLDAAGLPYAGTPPCLQERERVLAEAPFVSVVVATRDRPAPLAACLQSLLSLNYPNYEILVVDNAPNTSVTAELVEVLAVDESPVRYLREDRPGLSWARNRGLEVARGELIGFTDDDLVVDRHWLAALVEGFRVVENVTCVTGLALPLELETPAQLWFEQFGGHSKGFFRTIFDMAEHHPKRPLYPYNPGVHGHGCSMAFRTSVLREMGGFDPALGVGSLAMAGEEGEVFFNLIVTGHRIVYEPASLAYHLHRREYAALRKQVYGYGVGMTACLTKCLIRHPKMLVDFAIKLPYAVYLMLNSRSPRHTMKQAHYPKELTLLDLKGVVYGPLAYLRSWWHARDLKKT